MTSPIRRALVLVAFLAVPLVAADIAAQELAFPAASPPASSRDRVGLTTVEIEYARPGVKGRTIFGGLVPWDEVWRTGANAATRISFSTDVTFGGQPVEAGSYALFSIPGKEHWTVILNSNTQQWGSYGHDPALDVLRVTVDTETLAEPVETMRLSVERISDDAAELTFAWERSGFRVPIEVDLVSQLVPRIEEAMAAPGDEKPYLAAAMFYYAHDLDLDKALAWIDGALAAQPGAIWILYRKGLIHAKRGETDAARAAAEQARAGALESGGELGAEYARLSQELIDSLDEGARAR